MKVAIFSYNFPHYKSSMGLFNLYFNGFEIGAVFAAPPVELKFYQSKVRVSPRHQVCTDAKSFCRHADIPYYVVGHDSDFIVDFVKENKIDVGVILGARIIKTHIIEAFPKGILNMHPGLLPENRGLDNLKWAIIDNIKQGVTSHLIDSRIDMGKLIERKEIDVFLDDTLIDIHLRLQECEQKMMLRALGMIENGGDFKDFSVDGKYNRAATSDLEDYMLKNFSSYKENYINL